VVKDEMIKASKKEAAVYAKMFSGKGADEEVSYCAGCSKSFPSHAQMQKHTLICEDYQEEYPTPTQEQT
jgi:hypothetical protein